jgi:hypothetical protein
MRRFAPRSLHASATCARQPVAGADLLRRRRRVARTAALISAVVVIAGQTVDRMARGARGHVAGDGMRDAGPSTERGDRERHAREEHDDHDDAQPDGIPASYLAHGFTSTSAHATTLQG